VLYYILSIRTHLPPTRHSHTLPRLSGSIGAPDTLIAGIGPVIDFPLDHGQVPPSPGTITMASSSFHFLLILLSQLQRPLLVAFGLGAGDAAQQFRHQIGDAGIPEGGRGSGHFGAARVVLQARLLRQDGLNQRLPVAPAGRSGTFVRTAFHVPQRRRRKRRVGGDRMGTDVFFQTANAVEIVVPGGRIGGAGFVHQRRQGAIFIEALQVRRLPWHPRKRRRIETFYLCNGKNEEKGAHCFPRTE
jgi:hypothetical protein